MLSFQLPSRRQVVIKRGYRCCVLALLLVLLYRLQTSITRVKTTEIKAGHPDNQSHNLSSSRSVMTNLVKHYSNCSLQSSDNVTILSSHTCCTPFRYFNLINDSRDPSHTYYFPAEQLQFIVPRNYACDESTELFIAIKSAYSNTGRRNMLRKTWLSQQACARLPVTSQRFCERSMQRTKVAFFVSTPIGVNNTDLVNTTDEINQYQDVIQVSFVEHYSNLTLKTVSSLYWAVAHCKQASYTISTDDDMLLNVSNIWRLILSLEQGSADIVDVMDTESDTNLDREALQTLLGGYLSRCSQVQRSGKWATLPSAYAPARYPNYLMGCYALMSKFVAERLVRASLCTRLFWIDDAFLFGMLAEALGLHRRALSGILSVPDRPINFTLCNVRIATMFGSDENPAHIWNSCF